MRQNKGKWKSVIKEGSKRFKESKYSKSTRKKLGKKNVKEKEKKMKTYINRELYKNT